MAESQSYLICKKCHRKFIDDENTINNTFGFHRLGHRYKTCASCRLLRKQLRLRNKKKLDNDKENERESDKEDDNDKEIEHESDSSLDKMD